MGGLSWFQALLSILSGIMVALLSGYVSRIRENQRWLNENVYEDFLYDEVVSAADGNLPKKERGEIGTVWEDVTPYQRYRVDPDLRQLLDDYLDKLNQLNEGGMGIVDKERLANGLPDDIVEPSDPGVQRDYFIELPDSTGRERVNTHFEGFLDKYSEPIFFAESSEMLRENLTEEALGPFEPEGWDKYEQNWEEKFFRAFHESEYGFRGDRQEFYELKNDEIPSLAEDIRDELESRIDQGILRAIIRRWLF